MLFLESKLKHKLSMFNNKQYIYDVWRYKFSILLQICHVTDLVNQWPDVTEEL